MIVPAQAEAKKKKDPKITVMSRNVYLGADLGPAIGASSIAEAIDGAGEIYNEIERTDFTERAIPLAKEIKKSKADLRRPAGGRALAASRTRPTAAAADLAGR